jgi:hypothetical protein
MEPQQRELFREGVTRYRTPALPNETLDLPHANAPQLALLGVAIAAAMAALLFLVPLPRWSDRAAEFQDGEPPFVELGVPVEERSFWRPGREISLALDRCSHSVTAKVARLEEIASGGDPSTGAKSKVRLFLSTENPIECADKRAHRTGRAKVFLYDLPFLWRSADWRR